MQKDNKTRCRWVNIDSDIYVKYHDEQWGTPVYDDATLSEMLILESFHTGLSWFIILKKRQSFREAFDNFDLEKISAYNDYKIRELMDNEKIVRNRLKIEATIKNAQIILDIKKECGSFSNYIWGFTNGNIVHNEDDNYRTKTELSDAVSNDMKKRGMNFLGSVTVYSYLQAVGVVNDHDKLCFRYNEIKNIN